MWRLPTTARIAALSILLALLSNLALIGFIHFRTHDDALGALRQRVTEQADVLADVYASGGRKALSAAIAHGLADDPESILALLDSSGRVLTGNLARPPHADFHNAGYQTGELNAGRSGRQKTAGFVVRGFPGGEWLVSGRSFDERLTLQRTLERSLIVALLLSLILGVACGLLIARYVGFRVETIVRAVDEIGDGDLSRRAPLAGGYDAFDRLSARINRMLDRIAGLMDELRLVTDGLAHDLRSPVGRLRARIEGALSVDDEGQRDQLLAGVIEEADALTRMLTTVMEISRSEAMAGRQRFAPIDPAALVGELAEMYEPLAEEAGVRLRVSADAPPPSFMGHRQLLAQAMSNLVDNALVHGAKGGQVTLSAGSAPHGMVRLGVADCGPGIAPADHAAALRRFGRLDSSRSTPGAGLGLALASAVAHLHGGRLELDDARPGLIATILLPLDTRPQHA